jgi:hypothetical protein
MHAARSGNDVRIGQDEAFVVDDDARTQCLADGSGYPAWKFRTLRDRSWLRNGMKENDGMFAIAGDPRNGVRSHDSAKGLLRGPGGPVSQPTDSGANEGSDEY